MHASVRAANSIRFISPFRVLDFKPKLIAQCLCKNAVTCILRCEWQRRGPFAGNLFHRSETGIFSRSYFCRQKTILCAIGYALLRGLLISRLEVSTEFELNGGL